MNIEELALKLKQEIGVCTMFSKDNEGYSLSEDISTQIAIKVTMFLRDNTSDINDFNNLLKALQK